MFEGCESSLEGDSSNDVEEDNMQDVDIKELLGWLSELLHVPNEKRRARKKCKAPTPGAAIKREGGRDVDIAESGSWAEAP
jgi:hypothetical protein